MLPESGGGGGSRVGLIWLGLTGNWAGLPPCGCGEGVGQGEGKWGSC